MKDFSPFQLVARRWSQKGKENPGRNHEIEKWSEKAERTWQLRHISGNNYRKLFRHQQIPFSFKLLRRHAEVWLAQSRLEPLSRKLSAILPPPYPFHRVARKKRKTKVLWFISEIMALALIARRKLLGYFVPSPLSKWNSDNWWEIEKVITGNLSERLLSRAVPPAETQSADWSSLIFAALSFDKLEI